MAGSTSAKPSGRGGMSWLGTVKLARWLGPWASPAAAPSGIVRRSVKIPPEAEGDRPLEAHLYLREGRAVRGAWLISPGLHYLGAGDPRLDRLCRILASTGAAVLAPFLPDHLALRVTPRTPGDLERAFDALLAQPEVPRGTRPAVFSISFGSLPALRLAAGERCADRIAALVLFGGYADFAETIRFVLTGEVDGAVRADADPLNRPVLYLNVLDAIAERPRDTDALTEAWHRFCVETWGREEMKAGGWRAVAERLCATLPEDSRPLFRLGTGLDPRSREVGEAAIAALDTSFCDPRHGGLERVRCEVHVVHGAGDTVIPSNQAAKIAAALPPHTRVRVHLTGLYSHAERASGLAPLVLARELRTMWRIVRTLANAPG